MWSFWSAQRALGVRVFSEYGAYGLCRSWYSTGITREKLGLTFLGETRDAPSEHIITGDIVLKGLDTEVRCLGSDDRSVSLKLRP